MGVREQVSEIRLDATQLEAVNRACSDARVTLISGPGGSGKSTLVKTICERLEERNEKILLCAFAGKAAARLREATGRPASTIHRLLKYDSAKFGASDNEFENATICIDEASMLDSFLLSEVTRRNPKRLVLVGDVAQLPPVGRGAPYSDLITLRPDLAVNLTKCYRASEAVYQVSTQIRAGNCPPATLTTPGERWSLIETGDAKRTQATVLEWVTSDKWDWNTDIVLVPRNGESDDEASTVRGLNRAIADAVRPRDWERTKFVVGDRVVNGKNLPLADVWNGTTGTVSAIDIDGGVWVRVDEPVQAHPGTDDGVMTDRVLFSKTNRKELSLAYALSIHKSQGSQYDKVIVVCLFKDSHSLLSRSLLYTAVTRARQAAVVCGEVGAFKAGIQKVEQKKTVMQYLCAQEVK